MVEQIVRASRTGGGAAHGPARFAPSLPETSVRGLADYSAVTVGRGAMVAETLMLNHVEPPAAPLDDSACRR